MALTLTPRSLHLCVDMQRLFSAEGVWPTPWMDLVLPRVVALSERFPERTIFTRFIPPQRPQDMPGQWQAYYRHWPEATRERLDPRLLELMPSLAALVPPATVLDKPVYSAFAGRKLQALLRERDADALIVSGGETDVCVLATVLGAIDHGWRVVIATDAVCSQSDQGHDALLELFRTRYSQQVETAEVEAILLAWPQA
jgi:nicotinamidase-related amidase